MVLTVMISAISAVLPAVTSHFITIPLNAHVAHGNKYYTPNTAVHYINPKHTNLI